MPPLKGPPKPSAARPAPPKPKPPKTEELEPYWQTTDGRTVRLYQGDVLEVLRRLPSGSVQCAVTSPPYWGLRDYQTGTWEGGDPECDHKADRPWGKLNPAKEDRHEAREASYKDTCGKCGATRTDRQIGSERTPDCGQLYEVEPGLYRRSNCAERDWATGCHVCRMVMVFREVRRVLRDDGTLWLNYGDSYGGGKQGGESVFANGRTDGKSGDGGIDRTKETRQFLKNRSLNASLPSGNLVGVPWRVALALQADGWVLRQDIPWVKRSPMPESVVNRPAKALENVFLLVKKMGYFYDADAVKKVAQPAERVISGKSGSCGQAAAMGVAPSGNGVPGSVMRTGDRRNFWNADLWFESVDKPHGLTGIGDEIVGIDVTSRGYDGAHFATYPAALITPFIRAGSSEKGCCADCGSPWVRIVERRQLTRERPNEYVKRIPSNTLARAEEGVHQGGIESSTLGSVNTCANTVAGVETKTTGWRPTCECHGQLVKRTVKVLKGAPASVAMKNGTEEQVGVDTNIRGLSGDSWAAWQAASHDNEDDYRETTVVEYESDLPLEDHPVVPCVILDPFLGSGTTCDVAIRNGRASIGIDLSEKYLTKNAIPRIEGALGVSRKTAGLVARDNSGILAVVGR